MIQAAVQTTFSRMSEWTASVWFSVVIGGILAAMIFEQVLYQTKRDKLPGPSWVVPFIGGIVAMVIAPFDFWHNQMKLGPLSWNAIIGQFFVMVCDGDATRKVFKNVSERMPLMLHPNAELLLGRTNIAFLNGPEHKSLKASLLPLFSFNALSVYLKLQDRHIRATLNEWIQESKLMGNDSTTGLPMRPRIYDMNTQTSMTVFIGPYLTDSERREFQQNYTALTNGMLVLPIYLPGTALWKAKVAVTKILQSLEVVAARAKASMRAGNEPQCILDFWMVDLIKRIDECEQQQLPRPQHSTDAEVAHVCLDFLFASQDASTSSLTFTVHLLCQHPDVLARVRAEQHAVRPDLSATITQDMMNQMTYTRQVMREILRLRPPATIVPHLTKEPFELNSSYTAPAGTLLVPSIWSANRVGFEDPEEFDPDRFGPERDEEKKYGENFLTFGVGPHTCMGQRYAMNHIMLFIALFSTLCDFERLHTSKMHEIAYLPTIYPADDCPLKYVRHRVPSSSA